MIAVAAVLAAVSVGLVQLVSLRMGGHSVLLPSDSATVTRDVAAPEPLSPPDPFRGSSPPTGTPQASQPASATAVPSRGSATGSAGPATPPGTGPTTTPTPRPTPPVSYEAEARGTVRSSGTELRRVRRASGGYVVGRLGRGETLRLAVNAPATGRQALTIYYIAGERRAATVRVNGGRAVSGTPPSTPDWYTVGSVTIPVDLVAGGNTIEFGNPSGYAPDIDRITVR